MSSNLVDKDTGELITLSSGVRMWIGTRTAHDLAVQQGTIGNNILVCITDDCPDSNLIPRFPDYANQIDLSSIASNQWTATEDCYITYNYISGTSQASMSIDSHEVGAKDYTIINGVSVYTTTFAGYIKKDQVILATGINVATRFRAFPLLSNN